ncbi:hypothetical protein BKA70DRAFT_1223116 [Coprinopsis sp. MPI-PUGE-AT-0042]|nr:hypothetical protein BKA70DRAFT_1223116 [Coprinopsis sp. MPI-PUGE-AT-0042]
MDGEDLVQRWFSSQGRSPPPYPSRQPAPPTAGVLDNGSSIQGTMGKSSIRVLLDNSRWLTHLQGDNRQVYPIAGTGMDKMSQPAHHTNNPQGQAVRPLEQIDAGARLHTTREILVKWMEEEKGVETAIADLNDGKGSQVNQRIIGQTEHYQPEG